jgi:hypothetical protein
MGGQRHDRVSEAWVGADVYISGGIPSMKAGIAGGRGEGRDVSVLLYCYNHREEASESERELLHLAFICQKQI